MTRTIIAAAAAMALAGLIGLATPAAASDYGHRGGYTSNRNKGHSYRHDGGRSSWNRGQHYRQGGWNRGHGYHQRFNYNRHNYWRPRHNWRPYNHYGRTRYWNAYRRHW